MSLLSCIFELLDCSFDKHSFSELLFCPVFNRRIIFVQVGRFFMSHISEPLVIVCGTHLQLPLLTVKLFSNSLVMKLQPQSF